METYYLSDAPDLGSATVVVSTVAALDASVGMLLRDAARQADRGDRLLVALLWPSSPANTPVLTTLDERLAFLRQCAVGLGRSLSVVVVPRPEVPGDPMLAVLDALKTRCVPRSDLWIAPDARLPGSDALTREPSIAQALARGAMTEVAEALGAYFPVTGLVVTGDQRGRTLGYPTANLRVDARKVLPPNGVYAMRVRLPGEERATHPAAASIGVRPTFGADLTRAVEVFLLDMSLDLYGQVLAVDVVEYLRPELKFDSVEGLCEQMARDVERTRSVLASAPGY